MGRYKRSRDSEDNPDPGEDNGFAQFGGYIEAKKAKLLEQFRHQKTNLLENKSDIFSRVCILVNGYTKPSAEELQVIIGQHGGTFHQYQVLGGGTTHIIASNLPNVKITKLGSVPIVKPNWIVDSIETGRLLDFKKYLLHTNQSRTQPRLNLPVIDNPIANKSTVVFQFDKNDLEIDSDIEPNSIVHNNKEAELVKSVNKALIANINSNEPGKRAKNATDPTFLTDFYNNSRLHLIATLGAEFKQLVNQLWQKSNGIFEGLNKLKGKSGEMFENFEEKCLKIADNDKVIMHIDMDCFFVSVGLRNRPELRGKPVAVTHSRGNNSNHRPGVDRQAEIDLYEKRIPDKTESRLNKIDNTRSLSEIASCSYEARKYGIKNGMFMGPALQLCPDLVAIPYDFDCYKEVSNSLYKTIAQYTLNIEAVSCDEMYVDVTNILDSCNLSVEKWATYIRNEISEITGCPCSTGFGSNRLQARMATKKAKPNGQFYLKPQEVESYFYEQKVGDLPGVGYAILSKLKGINVETCEDIQNISLHILQSELGLRIGTQIFEQSKGIDKKPLQYEHERKSVSAEMNYGIRFKNNCDVYDFFDNLSREVHSRLQDTGMKSRCITLKLMVRALEAPVETAKYLGHGVCDSISRSSTLNSAMSDQMIILRETKSLFEKLNVTPEDIRGVGIQLSRLQKSAPVNKLLSNFLSKAKDQQNNLDLKKEFRGGVEEKTINDVLEQNECLVDNLKFKGQTKNCKIEEVVEKSKGRGRPKKIDKLKSKSNKLGNYFKVKGYSGENASNLISSQNSKIDMTVLNELPDDIRSEIMKEYGIKINQNEPEHILKDIQNKSRKVKAENELDEDFLDALPEDIRREVVEDYKFKNNVMNQSSSKPKLQLNTKTKKQLKVVKKIKVVEKNNTMLNKQLKSQEIDQKIDKLQEAVEDLNDSSFCEEVNFSSINPDDFKEMLNNWLRTEKSPLEFDTKLLSTYFYQLAVTRRIEILFRFMKFLTRNIKMKNDCSWHKAYYTILNHLQEGMVKEYDHTLYIPEMINCCCIN